MRAAFYDASLTDFIYILTHLFSSPSFEPTVYSDHYLNKTCELSVQP